MPPKTLAKKKNSNAGLIKALGAGTAVFFVLAIIVMYSMMAPEKKPERRVVSQQSAPVNTPSMQSIERRIEAVTQQYAEIQVSKNAEVNQLVQQLKAQNDVFKDALRQEQLLRQREIAKLTAMNIDLSNRIAAFETKNKAVSVKRNPPMLVEREPEKVTEPSSQSRPVKVLAVVDGRAWIETRAGDKSYLNGEVMGMTNSKSQRVVMRETPANAVSSMQTTN